MTFDLPPHNVFNGLSGLLLVLLGLAVLTLRPRRRTNVAFAVFSVAFGCHFIASNTTFGFEADAPIRLVFAVVMTASLVTAALALLAFTWTYVRPKELGRAARLAAAVAGLGTASVMAAVTAWDPAGVEQNWVTFVGARAPTWLTLAYAMSFTAVLGAAWHLLFLLALRRQERSSSGSWRSQDALLSAGLAAYPALDAGALVSSAGIFLALGVGGLLTAFVLAVLWLARAARRSDRAARNVALFVLAAALVGMLSSTGMLRLVGGVAVGLARTLGVLSFAYAILRHQLFGLDVKVKWTLKQSTIAGIFVAVFFAASEGAQAIFSGYGTLVGIGAAAVLVFAIHPLQHVAQRVADKAMPGVKAPADMTHDERRATYREMLRLAWQDGVVDRSERAMLQGMRARLGLSADEAERLEAEVVRG